MNDLSKFEDFNFSTLNVLDIPETNFQQLTEDLDRDGTISAASDIKEINLQELTDILEVAKHIISATHTGMLVSTFMHPVLVEQRQFKLQMMAHC